MAWCEAELRDIAPETPKRRTGAKALVGSLRQELSARNLQRSRHFTHELTRGAQPSTIYSPTGTEHGNFIPAAYRRILSRPEWSRRLDKAHTSNRQGTRSWRELDSAMSSDALLMNVFCYPRVLAGGALPALLGIDPGHTPEFGFKPRIPLHRGLLDTTEIDMRLGPLLLEAKLTESDFQQAPLRKLDRYRDLNTVFDRDRLPLERDQIQGYQLIRGVLAADTLDATFCVLSDARRPDLIEAWFRIMQAVRDFQLRGRLRLVTWQEVAACLPAPLRAFLLEKYGVGAQ